MSRVSAERSKSYLLISGRESRRVERNAFTHFKVLHALADLLDVTCALGSHDKRSFRRGIDSALSRHQILEAQSAGNREERVKVPAQSIIPARFAFSNLARSLRDGLSLIHMRRFLDTVPHWHSFYEHSIHNASFNILDMRFTGKCAVSCRDLGVTFNFWDIKYEQ